MPLAARIGASRGRAHPDRVTRTPSWRAWAVTGIFFVSWGTATYFIPSWGLGSGFWAWLMLYPTIELMSAASRRDIARYGGKAESEYRLFRGSLIAGLATAPVIFVIAWLQPPGDSLRNAALAAAACGCIVFLVSLFFGVGDSRSQRRVSVAVALRCRLPRSA